LGVLLVTKRHVRDLPKLFECLVIGAGTEPYAVQCHVCHRGWRVPDDGLLEEANWDFLVDHQLSHKFKAARGKPTWPR
jgi:hypothetical protein